MLRFHPIQFLIIATTQSIALGLSRDYIGIVLNTILAITSIVIISHRFNIFEFLKFVLAALPLAIGVFITGYMFAIHNHSRLEIAAILAFRMLCLGIVSFVCMAHLPYTKLITDLIQRRILNVKFGYALLAISMVYNTIKYDFRKILYLSKVRGLNSRYITLPLLISAARYSQVYAVSLYSRGLSESKTFYQPLIAFGAADFCLLTIHTAVLSCFLIYHTAHL